MNRMNEEQELPQGWVWTTVEETGQLIRGVTYSNTDVLPIQTESTEALPLLRANNIQGQLLFEDLVYVRRAVVKDEQIVRKNDIVIAMSSGSKNLVGKSAQAKADFAGGFGAFCGVFRPKEAIDAQYVGQFFTSPEYRKIIADLSAGSNINNLKREHINDMAFPLPPLPEQRRIVAKLEELFSKLDAGVAAVRRTQALLKRYRQSVLHAAVTGELTRAWREGHPPAPAETGAALLQRIRAERRAQWEAVQVAKRGGQMTLNDAWKSKYVEPAAPEISGLPLLPQSWSWGTFEEISERVTVGFVGSMKDEYVEEGIPFLRSQNVRENKYSSAGLKYVSLAFDESISKSRLEPGDVVVVRSGSVGTACVIPDTLLAANCSDLVIVKQPKVLPEYCAYYMNSVAKARVNAQKVGVALIHFNTQAQAAMPLSIPPLAEQAEIVAEVERRLTVLDTLSQTLADELRRAERLRQSILHRAFTGRLVPQDATDEPAAALLARLRATPAAPAKAKAGRGRKAAAQQATLGL